MIVTANTCPECGEHINLAEVHGTWVAACNAECSVGEGEVPEDALSDWSARAGAARAPAPSSLASFIVPRAPEGWRLTVTTWDGDAVLGPEDIHPLTLADAESSGADIYYGPAPVQKAANQ